MSDGPTADLNRPWEQPDPTKPYPKDLACKKGRSVECVAHVGVCAAGRDVDGREFILLAANNESLQDLWDRLMPTLPLGKPIYEAAIIHGPKFEGVVADPNSVNSGRTAE